MENCTYIKLKERPELKQTAAEWFHSKWGVPTKAYLYCMNAYLAGETEYGWYLCLDDDKIMGGMGVIENDFHDRKDLTPNVCTVYTEKDYRCKEIAGHLPGMVVENMKSKGITPIYLITDPTSFYERYDWAFLCMVGTRQWRTRYVQNVYPPMKRYINLRYSLISSTTYEQITTTY